MVTLSADEGPRGDSSLESWHVPSGRKGGSVTAGNSSTLGDGACAVVCTREAAIELG